MKMVFTLMEIMMSKYDWLNVPDEVVSIATDSDGRVLGYDVIEPYLSSNKDGSKGSYVRSYYWLLKSQKPYCGDWRDSLEERPNE